MNSKILTVIIPVYNVEDYIGDSLESLRNQTNHNFYTIFVDDCGKDKSIEIIQEYLESGKLSDAKIVSRKENGGLSAARNSGLKEATTDYVVFLDSDDYLDCRAVEIFLDSIEKYHADVLLFDNLKVPSNQKQTNNLSVDFMDKNDEIRRVFCENKITTTAWNKVVNRRFLENNHIYFQEGIIHEDILWGWKLFLKTQTLAQTSEVTLYYRERENSIMTTNFSRKNIDSLLVILEQMKDDICLLNNKLLSGYFYSKYLEFVLKIYKCSTKVDFLYAYKELKKILRGLRVAGLSKAELISNIIVHSPRYISIRLMNILLKTKFSYIH